MKKKSAVQTSNLAEFLAGKGEWEWLAELPMSRVKKPKVSNNHIRFAHLSAAHISKVLEKMHQSRLDVAPAKQNEANDGSA